MAMHVGQKIQRSVQMRAPEIQDTNPFFSRTSSAKISQEHSGNQSEIAQLCDRFKGTIETVLPSHIGYSRFVGLLEMASRRIDLRKSSAVSVFGAGMLCARWGLEPNPNIGHVYLIPYRNHKTGKTECQAQIGYQGIMDLVYRNKAIQHLSVRAVHQGDYFDMEYGLNERIEHRPAWLDGKEPGDTFAYYATCTFANGGKTFVVMSKKQIEQVRDQFSKSAEHGPWVNNFDAMAMKTVCLRLMKWLPKRFENEQILQDMGSAFQMDNAVVSGVDEHGQPVFNTDTIGPAETIDDDPHSLPQSGSA